MATNLSDEAEGRGPNLDSESVALEFEICPTKGPCNNYVRGGAGWHFEVDRYVSRMSTVWRSNALSTFACRDIPRDIPSAQGLGTSERLGTLIAGKGHSLSFDSPLSSRSMDTEFVGGNDNVGGRSFLGGKCCEFKATSAGNNLISIDFYFYSF